MKATNQTQARRASQLAHAFQRNLPDGGRLVVYGRHTDGAGLNLHFWICRQFSNPIFGNPEFPRACQTTVRGQTYLDSDGRWREPHGSESVRHFSTPEKAIEFASGVSVEGEQVSE